MTPFFQFFYVYGAIYVVYHIYSQLFTKSITEKDISFLNVDKSINDMVANPAEIPNQLNKTVSETKPYFKQLPFLIMNLIWLIIGLYTEQKIWFVLLFLTTPIETALCMLIKSVGKNKFYGYVFVAVKLMLVVCIYHFKFFA